MEINMNHDNLIAMPENVLKSRVCGAEIVVVRLNSMLNNKLCVVLSHMHHWIWQC